MARTTVPFSVIERGISQLPREMLPCMRGVSDRVGATHGSPWRRASCGLPRVHTASASQSGYRRFRGSKPSLQVPLSTLRWRSCERQRMTRGRC